jgi:hypothetical protein
MAADLHLRDLRKTRLSVEEQAELRAGKTVQNARPLRRRVSGARSTLVPGRMSSFIGLRIGAASKRGVTHAPPDATRETGTLRITRFPRSVTGAHGKKGWSDAGWLYPRSGCSVCERFGGG